MKEKLVFFGSGPYVSAIINILDENFDLNLVITTEKDDNSEIIKTCKGKGIKVISVSKTSELLNFQSALSGYKVAVLASFGLIIPEKVLSFFQYGIINIHPSLLPELRGPTPVQSAILSGKDSTGVSIIKLDDEVDHGPILASEEVEIIGKTSEEIYRQLFKRGAELLTKVLPQYISDELTPREQDHSRATFTETLTRKSGYIHLDNPPEKEAIIRMIKAYYPWPGVWFKTTLNGHEKVIKLLPDNIIQVEGKKPMHIKDFINGYHEGKSIIETLNINE